MGVVVVSCSVPVGTGPSATRSGSVVSSVAPPEPAARWCAGTSQDALMAMFGPDATLFTISSLFAVPDAEYDDPLSNFVDLTHSSVPWLCQGEMVPGVRCHDGGHASVVGD